MELIQYLNSYPSTLPNRALILDSDDGDFRYPGKIPEITLMERIAQMLVG